MLLLSILCVISHLIWSCNLNWLLNLYLIYETLWTGIGSGLLIFGIDVKMDGSVFEEKSSFKMLRVTFSSKLDWGTYIISIAKIASKKNGALIHSMKFISPEAALYLFCDWDSLHARLNSHCKAWKYKKKRHEKIKAYKKWLVHFCYWCENGWVCFWGKIF